MIIVTGGAGFIGSALIWQLNNSGINDLFLVDQLGTGEKWRNIRKQKFIDLINRDQFFTWLETQKQKVEAVIHMGACSSTTEKDADFLIENNTHYSMALFQYCVDRSIPFLYASSAATYGLGEKGFDDHENQIPELLPINKYGYSKQLFDTWVLKQRNKPPFWAGFKFFNVYGPNEQHKGSQASVVFHAFPQVRKEQRLKLFKSYKANVNHGEQRRDFVYIKDVVKIIEYFLRNRAKIKSGIYNLGTGEARTFVDLGKAVFSALNFPNVKFDWIDMPSDLKDQYQYFTQANIEKLRRDAHYDGGFTSLESGVSDYIQNYLLKDDPHL